MSKCPKCGSTGKVDGWNGWTKHDCKVCDGKGYLTNDEWRKICSAEEFAEFLYDIRYDYQVPWKNKGVVEWLKEKYNG